MPRVRVRVKAKSRVRICFKGHDGLLSVSIRVRARSRVRVGSNRKHMFEETYVFSDIFNIHFVEFWVKQKHIFLASEDF